MGSPICMLNGKPYVYASSKSSKHQLWSSTLSADWVKFCSRNTPSVPPAPPAKMSMTCMCLCTCSRYATENTAQHSLQQLAFLVLFKVQICQVLVFPSQALLTAEHPWGLDGSILTPDEPLSRLLSHHLSLHFLCILRSPLDPLPGVQPGKFCPIFRIWGPAGVHKMCILCTHTSLWLYCRPINTCRDDNNMEF